ncbi:MAG TPA: cation:proton antiporter [Gemmatimonadaceae bacterium]|nr:cation:proton antiporter [Gemmatimonadaceae bacterium]
MLTRLTIQAVYGVLSISLVLAAIRLWRGPSLPDRVVALDLIAFLAVGLIALTAVVSRQQAFIDVALTLALIAFLGTIAFARYVEQAGARPDRKEDPPSATS